MHRLRWNTIATITVDSITDILEAKPGHLARNISYGGMYELYHKGTAASQILYFLCRSGKLILELMDSWLNLSAKEMKRQSQSRF
jgi:hypothetical protein